jgi:hypothetical protein
MRAASISLSLLLAACELQPAPKQAPAPAPAAAPAPVPAPAPAAGSAAVPAVAPPSDPCQAAGVRVAEVLIADARDPQQKATLEAERAQIVRRTEEACMQQKWPTEIRDCIIDAKSVADVQTCQKKLQPAAPGPAPALKAPRPEKEALPPGTKLDEKTGKPVKADTKKPADKLPKPKAKKKI